FPVHGPLAHHHAGTRALAHHPAVRFHASLHHRHHFRVHSHHHRHHAWMHAHHLRHHRAIHHTHVGSAAIYHRHRHAIGHSVLRHPLHHSGTGLGRCGRPGVALRMVLVRPLRLG